MLIELRDAPFDPYAELARYQATLRTQAGRFGAASIFIGTRRDFNEGDAVAGLWLEHYPGMTERELRRLAETAAQRWPLLETLLLHRVGEILPEESIVLIATWSAHRAAALAATQYLIEALKQRAPFWKKETLADQRTRWVTHNTPG